MEMEELVKRLTALEDARNAELQRADELEMQAFRDKYAPKLNGNVGFADLLYTSMKQQGINTDAAIVEALYKITDDLRTRGNMLLEAVGRTEDEFRQRFAELRAETSDTMNQAGKMADAVTNAMAASGAEMPVPEQPPMPEQPVAPMPEQPPAPNMMVSDEDMKNVTRGNIPSSIINACLGVK